MTRIGLDGSVKVVAPLCADSISVAGSGEGVRGEGVGSGHPLTHGVGLLTLGPKLVPLDPFLFGDLKSWTPFQKSYICPCISALLNT